MKNKTKAIAVLGTFLGAIALTGCNGASEDTSGNILTYTDGNGNVIGYTAEELLGSYQASGTALSTQFDRIYEVLIRKYYSDSSQATVYQNILKNAQNAVQSDQETAQSNAASNGTSYEQELQNIFDSHSVENVDELLQYYIYEGTDEFPGEKDTFETNFYADNIDAIRDGVDGEGNEIFPESEEWGIGNDGWLKEEIPYHVRHILITVSASYSDFVHGEITQADGQHLAAAIGSLAGDSVLSGSSTRLTFGQIAHQMSGDEGSAALYGDLGLMADSYVNEFRLGVYAYESLYNKEVTTASYGAENVYKITPGLYQDATSVSEASIDTDQTVGYGTNQKTVYGYFSEGEEYDAPLTSASGESYASGIGTIPYGAAYALMAASQNGMTTDDNGQIVNDDIATTYPRNIIFNKYFNKHNVCVITPNQIAYNDNTIDSTLNDGVYNEDYGLLPGFQVDTTDILPQFTHNVLTNSEGQIVLAVRAGTGDYSGIHFIVVQRDGLSQYGNAMSVDASGNGKYEILKEESDNIADLSEYYTVHTTAEDAYPKDSNNQPLQTYINYNTQTITGGSSENNQSSRVTDIRDEIQGYSDAISTYIFQSLIEGEANGGAKIEFNSNTLQNDMQRYVRLARTSSLDDEYETWKDSWSTYAELLTAQTSAREFGYGEGEGQHVPNLVPEKCAIGFKNPDKSADADWQEGGVCYYAN